jgi:hypothetical protein
MGPIQYILINANILTAIGILHIYWLLGGKNSIEYFFPANSPFRKKHIKPKKTKLLFTSLALFIMAFFFIEQMAGFTNLFNADAFKWGNKIIAVIFVLRAFGNFTYVGFTKSFKKGTYAKLDTYLYSPICLGIATLAYLLSLTPFV